MLLSGICKELAVADNAKAKLLNAKSRHLLAIKTGNHFKHLHIDILFYFYLLFSSASFHH